jgi:dTDP-4-dehydrorhamnose reductase
MELWDAAHAARAAGADVRAVTVWALLGAFDWSSLLTRATGHYEPGAFDVRGASPRRTALGRLVEDLAHGRDASEPLARTPGWWRRDVRFPSALGSPGTRSRSSAIARARPSPLLVTGAGGTLGTALGRIADLRGLEVRLLRRAECDIADPASVAAALEEFRPWAVVNAAGYVRVEQAELEPDRCVRENARGAAELACACGGRGIRLVTFSSDLVFPTEGHRPYVESDQPAPVGVYGASKAEAERLVAKILPSALIVRTSAFFGPWDRSNLLTMALEALRAGREYAVPAAVVSPTYVPDLVDAVLDLLIDGEQGIWHLTNAGEASWLALVRRGAELLGVSTERLREAPPGDGTGRGYTALRSERGHLLPSLEDALERYARHTADQPARAAWPAVGA